MVVGNGLGRLLFERREQFLQVSFVFHTLDTKVDRNLGIAFVFLSREVPQGMVFLLRVLRIFFKRNTNPFSQDIIIQYVSEIIWKDMLN